MKSNCILLIFIILAMGPFLSLSGQVRQLKGKDKPMADTINGNQVVINLVPYADASQTGGDIRVWIKKK